MKPTTVDKAVRKNGYQGDDDNIRYKINPDYFNNIAKNNSKSAKKIVEIEEDEEVRYKFPSNKTTEKKPKSKPKIKVNFWSNKQSASHLRKTEPEKEKTTRRHTIGVAAPDTSILKPKSSNIKVRKRVSFLPSPLFSDNHVPMVTVPDDLTIHLNEEEANDLGEDLNLAFVNSDTSLGDKYNAEKKVTSPKGAKRKRSNDGNEHELEFFSKYVVQKLRKMETDQRIYSENLINTVLMLGQLRQLNGKSKIGES